MSTKIFSTYLGDGQVELIQDNCKQKIITDLPMDNGGKERFFSPTDLFASSLPACIMTIMGEMGKREGIDLSGLKIEIEKEMGTSPRRIKKIIGYITFPENLKLNEDQKNKFLLAIKACPVHQSLHPDVQVLFHVDRGNSI
ncbi:MAG: OsmC family protein [Oligoflexia bacterium]|nr:OsmC family protein [Oligoflexia bacterium]